MKDVDALIAKATDEYCALVNKLLADATPMGAYAIGLVSALGWMHGLNPTRAVLEAAGDCGSVRAAITVFERWLHHHTLGTADAEPAQRQVTYARVEGAGCQAKACGKPAEFYCWFPGGVTRPSVTCRRRACREHAKQFAQKHGLAMPMEVERANS